MRSWERRAGIWLTNVRQTFIPLCFLNSVNSGRLESNNVHLNSVIMHPTASYNHLFIIHRCTVITFLSQDWSIIDCSQSIQGAVTTLILEPYWRLGWPWLWLVVLDDLPEKTVSAKRASGRLDIRRGTTLGQNFLSGLKGQYMTFRLFYKLVRITVSTMINDARNYKIQDA